MLAQATNTQERKGAAAGLTLIDSPELQAPLGHYSHIAKQAGIAYISGQLPVTPDGTRLAGEPFEIQVRQVLANIEACLHEAGSSKDRLVFVTVYITDISKWDQFDVLYQAWLGDHRPARAVAGTSELHYGSAVEVHAVAIVGN